MINNFAWNRSHEGRAQIKPVTVAFGEGSTTIAYSNDGIYWNPCGNEVFYTRGNHGCWNGSIWVAVGTGGNWVATSYDGINWTGQDYTIFQEGYYVAWNGSVFVAAGSGNNNTLATSTDGISWTAVSTTSSSVFSSYANYVEWTGNVWCATGSGTNTTATCTSADGSSWSATSPGAYMVTDVSSIVADLTASTFSASSGTASNAFDAVSSINSATPTEWRTATASYNSDGTATTLYSTNVAGTTTYGEYLTVAAPSAVVAKYYVLIFNISGNLYELPSAWYLLGAASASPTSWTVIDTFSFTKTTPPTYGPRGYFAIPVVLSNTTSYQYYRFLFTASFAAAAGTAQNLRVMEADIFYECPTTYTVDRKIRPFVTPNGVMYPIRLGKYNYVVYADQNNQFVESNTFGLSYYSSDISGLDIYANSGFTRGFAYDGQNCVAIADGRMSYTGDFGKTWSDINPTYANTELYAITHNGTFFVMGGNQYVSVLSNSNTISYVSPAIVSAFSAAAVDSSSVSLAWSGSNYASVQLIWNTTGSTYSATTDSNATYSSTAAATTVNGLLANKKYYFKATPFSTYGEYGTAISDISAATAASLPTFYVSAVYDVSALVFFDGSFSFLDVSYGTTITFRYTANTATTATDISNLTPNTTYAVTSAITNIWSVRSAGKNATFLTNPKITTLTAATLDASSLLLTAANTAHYTSANLIWNTTGAGSGTTFYTSDASASYTASQSASIYMSNLTANTTYYYRATPVGSASTTGTAIYANGTTATTLTTFTISVYDTSATIVFDGSATYIDISYAATAIATTGVNGNTKRYSVFPGTTARDISNLTPDTSYNFTSATYNRAGARFSGTTINVYTLPKVSQITASTVTTSATMSSVTLTFTGNYTSLKLWWNTTGTTFYDTDASASAITATTYTVTGLPTNTVYYFRALPVGRQGAYGYMRDLSVNTAFDFSGLIFVTAMYGAAAGTNPLYLSTFSATYVDASNATVSWSGIYDKVTVLWDTSSGFTTASSTTIYNTNTASISNLSSNTTYYFRAQPTSVNGTTTGNTIVTNTTTNAVLTKFAVVMYDTSASVVFDGSMTYIDISYAASTAPSSTSSLNYRYSSVPGVSAVTDISNLTPDTSYVFQSTIYGRLGTRFAGRSVVSYTLPKVTQFSATETAFTSATVAWSGGKYTAMNLWWNVSGGAFYSTDASASNVSAASYAVTGLTTNTVYYFRAQPVGRQGALGVTIDVSMYLYNVYLSTFSAATFDSSTVSLTWTGAYDTATLLWDTSSAFTTASSSTFSSSTPAYTGTSTVATRSMGQLSANTWYYFKITPATSATVTATAIQGTAVTATAATAATITKFSVTMYDTSAAVAFDGSMSYIDISYAVAAVQTRYTSIPGTTSVTDISNLTPDTSYVFQSTIYNVAAQSFAGLSTVAYTLPKITQFSVSESTFTSATVTWSGGKYTAMNLWWNVSGGAFYSTDASASNITDSSYVATGLTTNTVYYFRAQPVGNAGAFGIPLDISAYIYNVYLSNFAATTYDSSSIAITWSGLYVSLRIVYDVSTAFSNASTIEYSSSESYGVVTNNTVVWGLPENTTYYFRATPYRTSTMAGTAATATAATAATITKFSVTMYDTSAAVAFDGSMSYIDISYAAAAASASQTRYTSIPGTTSVTDISNLTPDTSYVFQSAIYNSTDNRSAGTTIIAYTLPKVTRITSSAETSSSITLTFTGNYTSLNLWWNTTGTTFYDTDASASTITATTYTASNLSQNATYYFRALPVGRQGAYGNACDVSANTTFDFSGLVLATAMYGAVAATSQ